MMNANYVTSNCCSVESHIKTQRIETVRKKYEKKNENNSLKNFAILLLPQMVTRINLKHSQNSNRSSLNFLLTLYESLCTDP